VIKHTGPRYTIENLVNKAQRDVHVSRLKEYIHDPDMELSPLEVACRDNEEFVVGEIKGHEGNPRVRSTLKFLIHWIGYPDSEDSWEPYHELRHVDKLHIYLREHNMSSLIPKADREVALEKPS
jgi:hypothetical protein